MQEVTVHGKKRVCFVVMDGEVNKLVIPIDYLAPIDYKRLVDIESKAGNMLKNMKETVLDNGSSALEVYHRLIQVVPKKVVPKQQELGVAPQAPKKRGRKSNAEKAAAIQAALDLSNSQTPENT